MYQYQGSFAGYRVLSSQGNAAIALHKTPVTILNIIIHILK
jgi:hypothetical protein